MYRNWRETAKHFDALAEKYPEIRRPSLLYEIPLDQRAAPEEPNTYEVIEDDTFNVAGALVRDGWNPLVLNMASEQSPGGGWLRGTSAQEECMFYRSTYALTLDPYFGVTRNYYPLGRRRVVYSPYVLVFRNDQGRMLDAPFAVSCAAVPGVRNPNTVNGRLRERDERITEQKLHALVDLALAHHHDSLLLSALGCGAFHNPPGHIAEIFERVLSQRSHGLHVVFAILSVRDRRNFLTFRAKFANA